MICVCVFFSEGITDRKYTSPSVYTVVLRVEVVPGILQVRQYAFSGTRPLPEYSVLASSL
jgi:hypothetical protein